MIIWDDRGEGLLFISGTDNPVDIIHVNLINIWNNNSQIHTQKNFKTYQKWRKTSYTVNFMLL